MTDREKAIVEAFTGTVMLIGDKRYEFNKYVAELMGRPVYTHELPMLADKIKQKAMKDFAELCEAESTQKKGYWVEDCDYIICSNCLDSQEECIALYDERISGEDISDDVCKALGYRPKSLQIHRRPAYCRKCGAEMSRVNFLENFETTKEELKQMKEEANGEG